MQDPTCQSHLPDSRFPAGLASAPSGVLASGFFFGKWGSGLKSKQAPHPTRDKIVAEHDQRTLCSATERLVLIMIPIMMTMILNITMFMRGCCYLQLSPVICGYLRLQLCYLRLSAVRAARTFLAWWWCCSCVGLLGCLAILLGSSWGSLKRPVGPPDRPKRADPLRCVCFLASIWSLWAAYSRLLFF